MSDYQDKAAELLAEMAHTRAFARRPELTKQDVTKLLDLTIGQCEQYIAFICVLLDDTSKAGART